MEHEWDSHAIEGAEGLDARWLKVVRRSEGIIQTRQDLQHELIAMPLRGAKGAGCLVAQGLQGEVTKEEKGGSRLEPQA
eukprot:1145730-Pelagomonas_calceolata.AAC.3